MPVSFGTTLMQLHDVEEYFDMHNISFIFTSSSSVRTDRKVPGIWW